MSTAKTYPDSFDFQGFNEPIGIEWSVANLPVEGTIPDEIKGSFFRAVPDPAHPPFVKEDTMLSGDGMIGRFRIDGNQVDFALRYVETDRYLAEKTARRALFGAYRNPYTDDPSVKGVDRTVANTTPVWHAGRLLMTKEDGLPYEIDPETLETIGRYDFGGKLRSETMTAHVRIDPGTQEMFLFGYEADGLASRAVSYSVADKDGNLLFEKWFDAPYCSMLHDFAVTERFAVFPIFPTTADRERIEQGGAHWIHEPEGQTWIGIMPRYGDPADLRWFKGPVGASGFHIMNAFEEGDLIHLDLNVMDTNVFPFIRAASGIDADMSQMRASLVRWTFDMAADDDGYSERVIGPPGDMPRTAAKDQCRPYQVGYYATLDPSLGPPNIHGVVGAGFNALIRVEVGNGGLEALQLSPTQSISEPIHIPAQDPDHEGWLAAVIDDHADMSSRLCFLEAEHPARGPIASVLLPLRLRPQIHGWWVPEDELEAAAKARAHRTEAS
ncbi:carotenoid oxygenase [Aurantiacibacter xanthus]|uniref:Dioxygenase n=1 Tax=Aurantiacibacter xanthus TaxID=1784712 RepID=A0A3A1P0R3_9SPHN|nr:carotenoid oxygenase family protein [Aurantiacibacter xanthus]RIV80076.1 carotenoid oxygenase [Aurantiacibacter xanthus]